MASQVAELLKQEIKAKLGDPPEGVEAMVWAEFEGALGPNTVVRLDSRGYYNRDAKRSERKKGAFTVALEAYDQALVLSRVLKHHLDVKLRTKTVPEEGDFSSETAAGLGIVDERGRGFQLYPGKSDRDLRNIKEKKRRKEEKLPEGEGDNIASASTVSTASASADSNVANAGNIRGGLNPDGSQAWLHIPYELNHPTGKGGAAGGKAKFPKGGKGKRKGKK
jgi:hypothetical protein